VDAAAPLQIERPEKFSYLSAWQNLVAQQIAFIFYSTYDNQGME
jgi:hypothetical protein